MSRLVPLCCLSLALLSATGCAPIIVGGAAAGASAAYDRRTTGAFVEDESIEIKALHAIAGDNELHDRTHINITSINGVVLMSGEAPTAAMKQRAEKLVRDVEKVRQVHNEVNVMERTSLATRSNDTFITSKVKTKLLTDFDSESLGTRIKVVTENSVVYLMGLVTREEGERAARGTSTVGGIERVVKVFEYLD
jgi:osmotically-inducible protein OsmY